MVLNQTLRLRPLVKCHYSFLALPDLFSMEEEGIASGVRFIAQRGIINILILTKTQKYEQHRLIKINTQMFKHNQPIQKYFCIGELCALNEDRGVQTCVNITELGGAEPIKNVI